MLIPVKEAEVMGNIFRSSVAATLKQTACFSSDVFSYTHPTTLVSSLTAQLC